jgi:hypothetical protein
VRPITATEAIPIRPAARYRHQTAPGGPLALKSEPGQSRVETPQCDHKPYGAHSKHLLPRGTEGHSVDANWDVLGTRDPQRLADPG